MRNLASPKKKEKKGKLAKMYMSCPYFTHPNSVSLIQSIRLFIKLVPCWAPLWTVVWLLSPSCFSSAKSFKKKENLGYDLYYQMKKVVVDCHHELWLLHQNLKWVNVERGILAGFYVCCRLFIQIVSNCVHKDWEEYSSNKIIESILTGYHRSCCTKHGIVTSK